MAELTKEDILRMFAETDQKFRETDRRLDQRFQETVRIFRETDRRLDQRFRETAQRFKDTDKELNRLERIFTGQWGKLIEALVAPSALRLFQERGIKVTETHRRVESVRNGSKMEIDILLSNTQEEVVTEVKTTLKVEDVREFLEKLRSFLLFFPGYKGMRLYGGVAGIHIDEASDKFAYRQGLFVLAGSGEGMVKMLNDPDFRPKDFGDGLQE